MAGREVGFVVTDEYKAWIEDVKKRIKQSQIKAAVKVNTVMLDLYWDLGKDIVAKQKTSKWGDSFLTAMSKCSWLIKKHNKTRQDKDSQPHRFCF